MAACMLLFFLYLFRKGKTNTIIAFAILFFSIANIIIGPMVNAQFLNKYGVLGEGVVVDVERTNTTYNEEPVMRYNTLIRKQDGTSFETSFTSMDFNTYPNSFKGFRIPPPGVEFKVKYVPGAESNFVIMAEEDSQFSNTSRCNDLLMKIGTTQNKLKFDETNENYKKELETHVQAYLNANCGNDALDTYYRDLIEKSME